MLSAAMWDKYLPIEFALLQFFVYALKGIPSMFGFYRGFMRNNDRPVLVYLICKTTAFFGLVALVIYDM
jgi:hypothetical protein